MNYTYNYLKLQSILYTTIRKRNDCNVRDVVRETLRHEFIHLAKVVMIDSIKLSQLPLSILLIDCYYEGSGILYRQQCYNLFQSFYETTINFSKEYFYLILLKKIDNTQL